MLVSFIDLLCFVVVQGGAVEEKTTWTYPSPQMFYNALARKGKLVAGEDEHEHMESVVALHNGMNEQAWNKVLQWEAFQGGGAKLLKFQGRPSDLSPKAWFKHNVLGHPLPFDRHDWTVLREDGTTARYVMDYYYDESAGVADNASSSTFLVDVRPALDGVAPMWQRWAAMPFARHISHSTPFEPLPMQPANSMKSQVQESLEVWQNIQADVASSRSGNKLKEKNTMSEEKARELAKLFGKIDCGLERQALDGCESEEEIARASMDFSICMAKTACPLQHGILVKSLQSDDDAPDDAIEAALECVSECVAAQTRLYADAKQQHPKLFSSSRIQ
jgi:hypothetical protein